MSLIGNKGVIILDADGGDAVTVTGGKLDVNASLTVPGDINIGNVDVLSMPDINIGTMPTVDATVNGLDPENGEVTGRPVLIGGRFDASSRELDDEDIGALAVTSKGYLITEDAILNQAVLTDNSGYLLGSGRGVMMMGYTGLQSLGANKVGALSCTTDGFLQVSIAAQSPGVLLNMKSDATAGTDTYAETTTVVSMAGAIRNDDVASLVDADNEVAPLQVNRAGSLYVHQEAATSVTTYGEITVGTSAATLGALAGAETECKGVIIQAQQSNTGFVMAGDLGITDTGSEGIAIYPGDTMTINIKSTTALFLRASNATEKVNVMVLQ